MQKGVLQWLIIACGHTGFFELKNNQQMQNLGMVWSVWWKKVNIPTPVLVICVF